MLEMIPIIKATGVTLVLVTATLSIMDMVSVLEIFGYGNGLSNDYVVFRDKTARTNIRYIVEEYKDKNLVELQHKMMKYIDQYRTEIILIYVPVIWG